MSTVQHKHVDALLAALTPIVKEFVAAAARSQGDFHAVETAGAAAILKVRTQIMTAGLGVSAQCAERNFQCPTCAVLLHVWERRPRRVQTCEGEATHTSVRYRCPQCHAFYTPLEEANGLANSQFTTMAQGLVGSTAAQMPYTPTANALEQRAIHVSSKEVDRMARDVAGWRREEESSAVAAVFGQAGTCKPGQAHKTPALFAWSRWRHALAVQISVDGAHVRSPEQGSAGLEWFEARTAVIAPLGPKAEGQKAYLAGVCSGDLLFDRLKAAWEQNPCKQRPVVFVADGAGWIWERVRLYFRGCIEVLDIYHAGEHLGSAAAALWGEGSQMHRQWKRTAREKLMAPHGVRTVLRTLLKGLRDGSAHDQGALRTEIGYLWRHRHRMRYHWLLQRGLPIGSGAVESAVKQVTTARLRGPGMKWTRQGADAMLTLRAAHLSGELGTTALRQHQTRMATLERFRAPIHAMAA
jgi:hypothetical protein